MVFQQIEDYLSKLKIKVSPKRQIILDMAVEYVQSKQSDKKPVNLNFICTHNSRRSQLSQVWSTVIAAYYKVDITSFSGGVEVTQFNETAVQVLEQAGIRIKAEGHKNPVYRLKYSDELPEIVTFSKEFDHSINPDSNFAAIMTCSDADENCPFIPGAELRIPLTYEDPKKFDGTNKELKAYENCSKLIAGEMMYIFSKISS